MDTSMNAERLFKQIFSVQRDPRSPAYKAGVLAALRYRLDETGKPTCPYLMGTAAADAWFAGTDEVRRRALHVWMGGHGRGMRRGRAARDEGAA